MKTLRIFSVFLMMMFMFSRSSVASSPDSLKSVILNAVNETSKYACTVLLNKDGESRCDYNLTEGKWYPYEPAWHTGQIINALIDAYEITGKKTYLKYAEKAGDWWCGLLITNNPRFNGMVNAIHGDYVSDIVFATVTDGTPGLFKLYRVTGIKKYAEVPTSAGEWMLKHMKVPGKPLFYDSVDPKTAEVITENSPFWKGKKHQTLDDVARPNNEGFMFRDMYYFTHNEKYKKLFLEICDGLVKMQGPDGLWMQFMPNDKAAGVFHPRFNLWYAESLLKGYAMTHDKRYLEAARKTLVTYKEAQREDGTIFYVNYLDGRYDKGSICGSAVAFAGLLWIKLVQYGVGDEFKGNIEKSFHWILANRFSLSNPDPNVRGAVINTRLRHKHGKLWLTQRDVGSSFGIRFLCDYYNYKCGDKK